MTFWVDQCIVFEPWGKGENHAHTNRETSHRKASTEQRKKETEKERNRKETMVLTRTLPQIDKSSPIVLYIKGWHVFCSLQTLAV